MLLERNQIVELCLAYENVYQDDPFHDPNWTVVRHVENDKVFAWIFEREGHVWVNVKCDPDWISFWRGAFDSVTPAYHLNKDHWNSIILDGTVPDRDVEIMIGNSFDLTKGAKGSVRKRTMHQHHRDEYPANLLKAIGIYDDCKDKAASGDLTEDQMMGLRHALGQLRPREKEMVILRFEKGMKYASIGGLYERSGSRVGQVVQKSLRKLSHPSRTAFVINGYETQWKEIEDQRKRKKLLHEGSGIEERKEVLRKPIAALGLSVRSFNALRRSGLSTIGAVEAKMRERDWHRSIRNMGSKSAEEVALRLVELGIIDKNHPGYVQLFNTMQRGSTTSPCFTHAAVKREMTE